MARVLLVDDDPAVQKGVTLALKRRGHDVEVADLVERWFAELTSKKLRRGVHRSVQALERDIRAWLTDRNDNPRPFTWTKTADEILDKVAAYCKRIPDSGHEFPQHVDHPGKCWPDLSHGIVQGHTCPGHHTSISCCKFKI